MKKNIKLIIGIVIGITIGAVSGVYATLTYSAGDIAYTKSGASTPISVSSALNELYQNKKETTDDVKNVTANGSITLDKYYKNLNINVPIPAGYAQVSGTKTITTKANNIDVSSYQYADTSGMYTADEYNAKTDEGVYWKKETGLKPSSDGVITLNIGFEPKAVYIEGFFNNPTKLNVSMYYLYKTIRGWQLRGLVKLTKDSAPVYDNGSDNSWITYSNGIMTLSGYDGDYLSSSYSYVAYK